MKRNGLILIAVLALAAVTVFLVMNTGKGTVSKELRDFAFTDTASVDKIFLADKTLKQVTLTKNPDGTWTVNGQYKARPDAVTMLLRTIHDISVREPVGAKAKENIVKSLITGSIKCEVYANGELQRLYYVGSETPDQLGTYMLLADPSSGENSSEPFVMEIKGFNGYLTTRYSPDVREWRDKTAFAFHVPDIRSVKVEHTGEPENSFIVKQSPNMQYGLQSITGKPLPFDTINVRQFLSYFIRMGFVNFINDFPKKDSVLASPPAHVITVQDAAGKNSVVKLYMKEGDGVLPQDSANPNAPQYDVDNMFALVNDGKDFVVVQYFVFGKILQTPEYFTRQRQAQTPN
ncbi:MAG TPA: hypothetical protein VK826_11765 [Bacteroidia bacterium]|nr:hypothetical protein [Bacteroidia bacterium]